MRRVTNPTPGRAAYEDGYDAGLQGVGFHCPERHSAERRSWGNGYIAGQAHAAQGHTFEREAALWGL